MIVSLRERLEKESFIPLYELIDLGILEKDGDDYRTGIHTHGGELFPEGQPAGRVKVPVVTHH